LNAFPLIQPDTAKLLCLGEPLLTMRSVLAANKFLTADVGIGARHITISSVGVPNSIMKLASHKLQNTLAISIHAPTQELREQIVPRSALPYLWLSNEHNRLSCIN